MARYDYIPTRDVDFTVWMSRFLVYVNSNLAKFGLVAADVAPLVAAEPEFNMARNAWEEAKIAAKARSEAKKTKRAECEALIRALVARIQPHPDTTNEDRGELGIPVKGSPVVAQSVSLQDNRPNVLIDIRPHLKHVLRIQNATDTGTSKGKPDGALGAEVWLKVGDPPINNTDMRMVGLATRSPYVVEFGPDDANKPVYYRLRWVSRSGEKGDWSEVDVATVAA